MFQDEKTTELDLNQPNAATPSVSKGARWTENRAFSAPSSRSYSPNPASASGTSAAIHEKHTTWLIKIAAAVSILLLSLWLF